MIRSFILLLLAAVFACKCGEHSIGQSPMVELETGPCFGHCPVFRLTALNNGLVRYEGIRFVEKTGRDSFQLTREECAALRKQVKEANIWQYPDRIESNVVDAPTATLSTFRGAQKKSVTGSIDRPAPLLELENQLKNLAEAHGLQVKRGVNPNTPPEGSRAELMVLLKPEVNAGNWIAKFTEHRFQLLRRMPEGNNWLVTYDSTQITRQAVIDLFKSSSDVIDVRQK